MSKIKWLITGTFLMPAYLAFAGSQGSVSLTDPLGGSESFASVLAEIMSFLFWDVALPLCTIMVLVGAFQMMTASGDPEKFSTGKKTLVYAAIGFAVALVAGGLSSVIQSILTGK